MTIDGNRKTPNFCSSIPDINRLLSIVINCSQLSVSSIDQATL